MKRVSLVMMALSVFLTAASVPASADDAASAAQEFKQRYSGPPKAVDVLGGWTGIDSGVSTETLKRVVSAKEWSDLWKTHAPKSKPPLVDFSKNMVIAVFLGNQVNEYDPPLSVRSLSESASGWELVVEAYPSDMIGKFTASPYLFVVVPRSQAHIEVALRGDTMIALPHLHYAMLGIVPDAEVRP